MLTRKLGFMIGRRALARQSFIPHGSEGLFQLQSLPSIQTVPVLPLTPQRTVQHRGYSTERSAEERIEALVKNDKVFIFMKGVPDMPRCGFSNAVVQIMRMHNVSFKSFDVLSDEDIRQGVKEFSNWPTIPQVYLDGEFIGGCDIVLQMHQNGELIEELSKIGIKSALLTAEEGEKT